MQGENRTCVFALSRLELDILILIICRAMQDAIIRCVEVGSL